MATLDIPVNDTTLVRLMAEAEHAGHSLEDHVLGILVAAARRPYEDFPGA